jgi:hypothetical protein
METMYQYKERLQTEHDNLIELVQEPGLHKQHRLQHYKRLSEIWHLMQPDAIRQWNTSRRSAVIENLF